MNDKKCSALLASLLLLLLMGSVTALIYGGGTPFADGTRVMDDARFSSRPSLSADSMKMENDAKDLVFKSSSITWKSVWYNDIDRDGLNDTVEASYDLDFNTTSDVNVTFVVEIQFLNGTNVDTLWFQFIAFGGYGYQWFQWRAVYGGDYWFYISIYANGTLDTTDQWYWYGADEFNPDPVYASWWTYDDDLDGIDDTISGGFDLYFVGNVNPLNVTMYVDILYYLNNGSWSFQGTMTQNSIVYGDYGYMWFDWHAHQAGTYQVNATFLVNGTKHGSVSTSLSVADDYNPPPFVVSWYLLDEDYDGKNDTLSGDFIIFASNVTLPTSVLVTVNVYWMNGTTWVYQETRSINDTMFGDKYYWYFYWQATFAGDFWFEITVQIDNVVTGTEDWYFYGADPYVPPQVFINYRGADWNGNGINDTFEGEVEAFFDFNTSSTVWLIVDIYRVDSYNAWWYWGTLVFNTTAFQGYVYFWFYWFAPFAGNFSFDFYLQVDNRPIFYVGYAEWHAPEAYFEMTVDFWWYVEDDDGDGFNDTFQALIEILTNSTEIIMFDLFVDIFQSNGSYGSYALVDSLSFEVMVQGGYGNFSFTWRADSSGNYIFDFFLDLNQSSVWQDHAYWYDAHRYGNMYTIISSNNWWEFVDLDFDGLEDTARASYDLQLDPRNDASIEFYIDIYYWDTMGNGSWMYVDGFQYYFTAFNGHVFQDFEWQAPFNATFQFVITIHADGTLIYNDSVTWIDAHVSRIQNAHLEFFAWTEDRDYDGLNDSAIVSVNLHGSNTVTTIEVLALVEVWDLGSGTMIDQFNVTLRFEFFGGNDENVRQDIVWHPPYLSDFNLTISLMSLNAMTVVTSKAFVFYSLNPFHSGTTTTTPSNATTTTQPSADNQTNSTTLPPPSPPTTVITPGFTVTGISLLLATSLVIMILQRRKKALTSAYH